MNESYAENIPYDFSENVEQELYLDVTVNESEEKFLGHFIEVAGEISISKETLNALKIEIPIYPENHDSNYIPLKKIAGLNYEYDLSNQKISLNVPVENLKNLSEIKTDLTMTPAFADPKQEKMGAMINYDVYTQHYDNFFQLNAMNEYRIFGLGDGGVLNVSSSYGYSRNQSTNSLNAQLLDIYWQKDFPDYMLSLKLGDAQSDQLGWSRSNRITGLSLSRNFSLQPYRTTRPLQKFAGQVSLPSTIDLFIDGIKQSTHQVAPGKFQLESLPVLNGKGDAELVVTDLNGRQEVVNYSVYVAKDLLEERLSDWSFNLGYAHLNYGNSSFEYGEDLILNAIYRFGINQNLTSETHLESTKDLYVLSQGFIKKLGNRAGILNVEYAQSRYQNIRGDLTKIGYSWSSRHFNFFYNTTLQSGNFNDVSNVYGATYPQKSEQIFVGISSSFGELGASYISQQNLFAKETNFFTLSWSKSMLNGMSISFNANRDMDNKDSQLYFKLSQVFNNRRSANISLRENERNRNLSVSANQSVSQESVGWGWQTQYNADDQTQNIEAQVTRYNQNWHWNAGLQNFRSANQSSTLTNATFGGGVLILDGHLIPMKKNFNSFALVSTSQIPDIPIRLENRFVGKTNKNGVLVVNGLNPYQHNRIGIDAIDLPLENYIESTEKDAVPRLNSGVFIHFPIYPIQTVFLNVKDRQGKYLPMGSTVWSSAQGSENNETPLTIVANDGVIYLESPKISRLYVNHNDDICSVDLPDLSKKNGLVELGELTCR